MREFKAARDVLVERFESWLNESGRHGSVDELTAYTGTALEWKWRYGHGDLARWDLGDAGEFLLEWCPRKLSVSQADSAPIPVALVAFVSFLDAEGARHVVAGVIRPRGRGPRRPPATGIAVLPRPVGSALTLRS